MNVVLVGIGGALGAMARYGVGVAAVNRLGATWPAGTFFVNLTGSFLIGVLVTLILGRAVDPAWRLFLVVGFLGGYTTFSSYAIEALGMLEAGRVPTALLYVAGSNLLGLAACAAGIVLGRSLL